MSLSPRVSDCLKTCLTRTQGNVPEEESVSYGEGKATDETQRDSRATYDIQFGH